jgi:hypothetical protein
LELSTRKHLIYGLLEADITAARRRIPERPDRAGDPPSFTGFAIVCVGQASDENKMVHAYRSWRDRLVLVDDVDITIIIEVEAGGRRIPLGHFVRVAHSPLTGSHLVPEIEPTSP